MVAENKLKERHHTKHINDSGADKALHATFKVSLIRKSRAAQLA